MNKLIFFLCCCFSMTAQVRELEVYFETGSFTLDPSQTDKLESFIESLPSAHDKLTINIAGHTDSVGDVAYNAVLSDNRANAIANIFKNHGFDDSAILTAGRGEVHPIADNSTAIGKAKNRRARIVVSDSDSRSLFKVENIGGLKLTETRYVIDAGREQNLNYRSGTKINIPKNAFVDRNGQTVKGKITIRYIEYRDPIDFMLSNISMEHGGGHFNSGGMFKILAYQDGKPISLKQGEKINFDFKLTDDLPNMGFYQYDTISRNWTELSRLSNGLNWGNDVFEDEVYYCPTAACDVYELLTFTANDFIRSGSSALDRYIRQRRDTDRKIADRPEWQQNVPAQMLLGTEHPTSAAALKWFENGIIASEHEVKKLTNEIAKTASHYSLVRIGNGSRKHKFKIVPNISTHKTAYLEQTVWTYKGEWSPKVFDQPWLSCAISGADDHYILSFKNQAETLVLKNVKMKNKQTSNREEHKLLATFNKNLESETAKLNELTDRKINAEKKIALYRRKIEKLKNGDFDQGGNDFPMKCFWQFSRQYMPANEKAMFAEEWLDFFDGNRPTMAERYGKIPLPQECVDRYKRREELAKVESNAAALTQSLSISNLGVFNCDQVQRLIEPQIATMEYRDKNGKAIVPTMIYLIDSKFNGILRYDGYLGFSPSRFPYSPKSENTLLAFVGNDSYIVSRESFKKATTEKMPYFLLTKIGNITGKRELAKLF